MDEMILLECPYCGHRTSVEVDSSLKSQDFTEDCEQCCRPMHVRLECGGGHVVGLAVDTE